MRADGPIIFRRCALAMAAIVSLSSTMFADDAPVAPTINADLQIPFSLHYSVQPGETLLTPCSAAADRHLEMPSSEVQHASFWQPLIDSLEAEAEDASETTSTADDDAAGLFDPLVTDESSHWSTTLDSAAESRVDAAVRAAGMAIVLLGVTLVVFLAWHRLRGFKPPAMVEASQLLERGRLPITQTCRLHLVRAGNCDVLVAVDRGSVKAMTPLPADFAQLTSTSFDSLAEITPR